MIYQPEHQDILFNDIVFCNPMILINSVDIKDVMLQNLENAFIPVSIITDKNHDLIISAERNKPNAEITVDAMMFNIFYKQPYLS